MAGYETRQSSYSDGDVIIAAHTNDEFDAIVAAMNAATGHAHDGTAGEGPVIALIGDAGSGSPLNRIQIDTANDQIGFFIDVAGSSVEQLRLTDGAFLPVVDGDVDLGSTGFRFKGVFSDALTVTNNIVVGGTVDGRNVSADGSKLDGIEANADVTDFTNVQAAGALMDSELTSISAVKALNQFVGTSSDVTHNSVTTTGNVTVGNNFSITDGVTTHANSGTNYIQYLSGNTGAYTRLGDVADLSQWLYGLETDGSFFFTDLNTATTPVIIEQGAGNNLIRVTSSSQVAIGASAANRRLEVNDSSNQNVIRLVGSNAGYLEMGDAAEPTLWRVGPNTAGTFTFKDVSGGDVQVLNIQSGAGANLLHLASNSKIGINDTSPTYKLDIYDDTDPNNNVLGVRGNNAAWIMFGDTSDPTRWRVGSGVTGNFAVLDANNSSVAPFSVEAGANADTLVVDSNGRVGVRTSSPLTTLDVNGSLSKSSGSFKIDHPLMPETHWLFHSFVEAPTADNIYRGRVDLVEGVAQVNLDEAGRMTEGTFVELNTNLQVFTSNESGWEPVRGSVEGNILTIESKEVCEDTVSWLVIGERHDKHMLETEWTDENGRIITEVLKSS